MKTVPSVYSIGIFAGISLCTLALTGCGAGTGQSLNAPGLGARSNSDASAGGASRGVTSSVLPAKRLGLYVANHAAERTKTAGASARPATFARTSDTGFAATDYAHVFVTLHKVELVSADDQTFPIWASDAGRVVDLATLRDASGERVALLGGVPAPGVTGRKVYKRARITLGKSILFLKRGETSGKPTPVDDAVGRDDEGRPVITALLDRPRDLGNGKEDLIIAFDQAAFVFAQDRVTPALREGRGVSTQTSRQEGTLLTGIVSESSAGGDGTDRVFVVTPDGGARNETQVVWLRSSAPFFRADGKPSPALADGARVAVRGTLEGSTKRLLAGSVMLLPDDEKAGDVATITGTATTVSADGGSLSVAVSDLRGVEPAYAQVTTMLGEGAVLRGESGLVETPEAFFATLKKPGAIVEVSGEYEPTTGVLVASRLRRVNTPGSGTVREASVLAAAQTVGDKSLTVVAPLLEWDGIVAPATGKAWTVTAAPTTVCRDKNNKTITLSELLTAAKDPDANAVRVIGTYAGGAIAASRLELRPVPAKETAAKSRADKTTGDAVPGGKKSSATKRDAAKPAPATDASPDAQSDTSGIL